MTTLSEEIVEAYGNEGKLKVAEDFDEKKRFYTYDLVIIRKDELVEGTEEDKQYLKFYKSSVVYTGKGTGDRAEEHLRQAFFLKKLNDREQLKGGIKTRKFRTLVLEGLDAGHKLGILKSNINVDERVASVLEAVKIDFKLPNYTNQKAEMPELFDILANVQIETLKKYALNAAFDRENFGNPKNYKGYTYEDLERKFGGDLQVFKNWQIPSTASLKMKKKSWWDFQNV